MISENVCHSNLKTKFTGECLIHIICFVFTVSDKILSPFPEQISQVLVIQFPCQCMSVLRNVGPTTLAEWAGRHLTTGRGLADWIRVST